MADQRTDPQEDIRALALSTPSLRGLLDGHTGLQPAPRPTRLGAPGGAAESWSPPVEWSLSDSLDDMLGPTFLTDLITFGVPNGNFSASDSEIPVSDYWTVSDGGGADVGTMELVEDTTRSGRWKWRYSNDSARASADDDTYLTSPLLPYAQGDDWFAWIESVISDTSAIVLHATVTWYDEDQTALATSVSRTITDITLAGERSWRVGPFTNPNTDGAAFIQLTIEFHCVLDSAGETADVWVVRFKPLAQAVYSDELYPDTSAGDRFLLRAFDPDISTSSPIVNLYNDYLSGSIPILEMHKGSIVLQDQTGPSDITLISWGDGGELNLYGDAGVAVSGSQTRFTGIGSPTPGASQDDWDPSGNSTATIIRAEPSNNINVTGMQGGTQGRMVMLQNISTSKTLTLVHGSASSSAANRFLLPSGSNLTLQPYGGVMLWYDGTSNRWRALRPS